MTRSLAGSKVSRRGLTELVAGFDHVAVVLPYEKGDLRRLIGKKVGILRTDDPERPIRVRVIPPFGAD